MKKPHSYYLHKKTKSNASATRIEQGTPGVIVFRIFYESEIENSHRTNILYEVYFHTPVNLSKLT